MAAVIFCSFPLSALAWDTSPTSLKEYAVYLAIHENLNVGEFLATINCESGFNAQAVGDHGTSIGVAQIHLPAHPDISEAEASNGIFSLNWMADQWVAGRQKMWSCWKPSNGEYFADK